MPLKSEHFTADIFLPWAANLLPESEQLRTLGQLLGMARSDVIGLLSAIGGDTAGAFSFGQAGRASAVQWRPVGRPEELERMIENLPNKPFLVGEEGVSMSLAGVQSKIAVAKGNHEHTGGQTFSKRAVNSWPLNDYHNKFRDFLHKLEHKADIQLTPRNVRFRG
jgi:hypothetical protein